MDVTESILGQNETGIQRVVKEFAFNSQNNLSDIKVICVVWDPKHKDFFKIDTKNWEYKENNFQGKQNKKFIRLNLIESVVRLLIGSFLHLNSVQGLRDKIRFKNRIKELKKNNILEENPYKFGENDQYFTADVFWNSGSKIFFLNQLKSRGVKMYVFIHDLLPITHPKLFPNGTPKNFEIQFQKMLKIIDKGFTSSKHVQSEYNRIFPDSQNLTIIPLGANPKSNKFLKIKIENSVPQIIMVGSIEPRKNYTDVINWANKTNLEFNINVIGKCGWKNLKLLRALKKNRKFSYLGPTSDIEKENQITNADIAICASLNEGYGLPLREFLAFGIPVVASDIPPFRELAECDLVFYFQPGDLLSLESAVRNALRTNVGMSPIDVSTWKDATKELLRQILF